VAEKTRTARSAQLPDYVAVTSHGGNVSGDAVVRHLPHNGEWSCLAVAAPKTCRGPASRLYVRWETARGIPSENLRRVDGLTYAGNFASGLEVVCDNTAPGSKGAGMG